MADRSGTVLAVVACLLVIVSLPGATVTAQSSPDITLKVNQQTVQDGDSIRISERPSLDIAVSADSTIDVVTVRVDGEARHSFSPGSPTFSRSVQLATDDGEHEIRLVVSTNRTTRISVSVLQDRIPPFVSYTSPLTTDRRPPPATATVENGTIRIAGDFTDATGVESIHFEQNQRYTHLGLNTRSRSFSIQEPGDSFSKEFFLGPDPVQNEFTITYLDGAGNRREHVTTLNVSDGESPTLNVAHQEESNERVVFISGSASDNTQLKEIYLEHDGTSHYILSAPKPAPNPENRRHRFTFRLSGANALQEGMNEYAVVARDYAGNTQRVPFQIRYVFTVEPVIRFDREDTAVTDDGIRVVGGVDSGEITSVILEAAPAGRDESTNLINVYSGSATRLVDVNRTIGLVDGPTEVRIRAIDSNGEEHVNSLIVEDGSIAFPAAAPTPTPPSPVTTVTGSPSPTPPANGTGTATASTSPPSTAGSGDSGSGSDDAPAAVTNTETSSRQLPGFGMTDAIAAITIAIAGVLAIRARHR